MGLKQIIGFLLPEDDMSATWGVQTVRVSCLIEMDSPLEGLVDVQQALPAYDGGTTSEPTFTIGLSHHPDRSDLLLKSAESVREYPSAGRPFWLVDLTYETPQWLNDIFPGEDAGRGNQGRAKKLTTTGTGTAAPAAVVIEPWNEPPTWSSSTRRVKMTRYKDAAGVTLRHANGMPLTEGIDVGLDLEVHQFTWNVQYSTFDYDTAVAQYIGKINSVAITRFKSAPIQHVLLESCTCVENYRDVNIGLPAGQSGSGTQTFHFITLNATFVIDRRSAAESPEGYFREANRRVSMHTLQLTQVLVGPVLVYMYVPIPVNERGDFAQSPWPLLPTGAAVHYQDLFTANPETDFAFIDPALPLAVDLGAFATANGLEIP